MPLLTIVSYVFDHIQVSYFSSQPDAMPDSLQTLLELLEGYVDFKKTAICDSDVQPDLFAHDHAMEIEFILYRDLTNAGLDGGYRQLFDFLRFDLLVFLCCRFCQDTINHGFQLMDFCESIVFRNQPICPDAQRMPFIKTNNETVIS